MNVGATFPEPKANLPVQTFTIRTLEHKKTAHRPKDDGLFEEGKP